MSRMGEHACNLAWASPRSGAASRPTPNVCSGAKSGRTLPCGLLSSTAALGPSAWRARTLRSHGCVELTAANNDCGEQN
jgi:hypothetical protein